MENKKYSDVLYETMFINKLSNGLTCYIIPKKDYVEKQAAICTNYGSVDSQFSVDGKTTQVPDGIAHFLEHKLFEDEKMSVFDEFVKLGANVNAFTNFTNTAYYFNSIDNFDENLALLLDFTSTPYFTDENVEKEKGIIAQEINMYSDNPYWQMYLNLQDAMYENCPVKKNIAGSVDSIMQINKDMLYECYETFYYSENMALICVGDFDNERIYDIAERHIKPKKQRQLDRIYGEEPAAVKTQKVENQMSLSRPMFNLGFKEQVFDGDIVSRIINTKILMDVMAGESSSFFNEMYANGQIDGAFGLEYVNSHFYGTAVFAGSTDDPDKVAALIMTETERIKKQGINEERFEQIRNKHIGRFVRSFNSIDAIATGQIDLFSKGLDIFDIMEGYKSCTKAQLSERLNQLFNTDNVVLSIMKPT